MKIESRMEGIESGIRNQESSIRDSLFPPAPKRLRRAGVIRYSQQSGFALLFAVLATSILLAIGASIWNLALREVTLSSFGRESQLAFYTADSAIECALYWDFVGTSAFATSSISPLPPSITCGQGVSVTPQVPLSGVLYATSTFSISLNTGCASVAVGKSNPNGGVKINTHIESRGQNRCILGDPTNVERGVRVKY